MDEGHPCPCGRASTYGDCCGRYHRGAIAEDAETLMRSRFAAFVVRDAAYLARTLHSSHDGAADRAAYEAGLARHLAGPVRYRALRVLGATPEDADGVSKVLFSVDVIDRGRARPFAEVSSFARDGGVLGYVAGLVMSPREVADLHGEGAVREAERRFATRSRAR